MPQGQATKLQVRFSASLDSAEPKLTNSFAQVSSHEAGIHE